MELNSQNIHSTKHKSKLLLILCTVLAIGGFLLVAYINSTKTPTNPHQTRTDTPEENMFYIATKMATPVIFYRYPDIMIEHKNPPPSVGHFAAYEQPYDLKKNSNEHVDFKELRDARKLFSFQGHAGIENYVLSEDKRYLLLSFLGGRNDGTNYIYQINLETLESTKIWEHELRSGDAPYNGGIAHVTNFIPDHYIVFSILKGEGPPTALPVGTIIKNIKSRQEKVLGVVGDVQIDPAAGTVSFRKLEKTQAPCERDDPVCFATDTYKFVYKPGGPTLSQPLP